MIGTSGPTSPAQFAYYDPAESCWKTWPAISLWGSVTYSGTWPKSGMTRGGRAYELPTSAAVTAANGCSSLLPTPTASEARGTGKRGTGGPDLRTALLPTPAARLGSRWGTPNVETARRRMDDEGRRNLDLMGRNARPLNEVVVNLLPTPRATDGTKGGPNQRGSSGDLMLPSAVVLLPTPTSQAAKHAADDRGPGTLDDCNLWSVAARIGALTPPLSLDGSEPSAEMLPLLLNPAGPASPG